MIRFFTPSFLIVALFVFGGMMFKSMAPRACGTILSDDSIFVLTGDARRIPFAMRKMRENPDVDLYIIGAGGPGSYETTKKVNVESESKSTYQNAMAIRDIANKTGLDRIVVVTTEDHMNRAQYLIAQELPNTEIVACPVPLTDMPATKRLERWTTEYVKYIVTMFGIKEG
ncbi:YdcF family protein [bacterium]|nr:YdcF family protein [bacterium]